MALEKELKKYKYNKKWCEKINKNYPIQNTGELTKVFYEILFFHGIEKCSIDRRTIGKMVHSILSILPDFKKENNNEYLKGWNNCLIDIIQGISNEFDGYINNVTGRLDVVDAFKNGYYKTNYRNEVTSIKELKDSLPEMPDAKKKRFKEEYGLSDNDIDILIDDINVAKYFEETNNILNNPKILVNWIIGPIFKEVKKRGMDIISLGIDSQELSDLIKMVLDSKINISIAREKILPLMIDTKKSPMILVEEQGLSQIYDIKEIEDTVFKVVEENKKSVNDYLSGKQNAIMFLVGQVMKQTNGKLNPKVARDLLEEKIKSEII